MSIVYQQPIVNNIVERIIIRINGTIPGS